ncbi:hypothetical protein SLS63_000282 [Diaporthe eres]|uniref:Uncharacterized protein n=1 Tax=Diaporthe eres TaxID=83184 RepID=A0ABR1PQD3_DIAER
MAYTTPSTNTLHTLIPGWTNTPIPNFSLSAAGLLVLADLNTIAQRTSLRGGSSWFDSLLLAPGLHYQQAADEVAYGDAKTLVAVEIQPDGKPTSHQIVNQAVVNYVLRTAKEGGTVVLDVGWALALTAALMLSRILNIFVIKQRSRPKPKVLPPPFSHPLSLDPRMARVTQYTINISPVTTVILRGLSSDLQALTTTVWLRPKTHAEGYLEAIAKVLVYLVAACSGNATQAGNLILLVLLLISGGMLALSNASVKGLRSGGRLVAPSPEDRYAHGPHGGGRSSGNSGRGSDGRVGTGGGVQSGNGHRSRVKRRETTESWPESSDLSSLKSSEDSLEKGEAPRRFRRQSSTDSGPPDYHVQVDTRLGVLEVVASRGRR